MLPLIGYAIALLLVGAGWYLNADGAEWPKQVALTAAAFIALLYLLHED